jgi:hypothetical protein
MLDQRQVLTIVKMFRRQLLPPGKPGRRRSKKITEAYADCSWDRAVQSAHSRSQQDGLTAKTPTSIFASAIIHRLKQKAMVRCMAYRRPTSPYALAARTLTAGRFCI